MEKELRIKAAEVGLMLRYYEDTALLVVFHEVFELTTTFAWVAILTGWVGLVRLIIVETQAGTQLDLEV